MKRKRLTLTLSTLLLLVVIVATVAGGVTWLIFKLSPYQQEWDHEEGTFEVVTPIDYVDSWLTFEGEGISNALVQGKDYDLTLDIQHSRADFILDGDYELKFNATIVMSGTITDLPSGQNATSTDMWTATETGTYNTTLDLVNLVWQEQVIFTSVLSEGSLEPIFELLSPSMVDPGASVDFSATVINNIVDKTVYSYDYQILVDDGSGWTVIVDTTRRQTGSLGYGSYDTFTGSFTAPSKGGQYMLKFKVISVENW